MLELATRIRELHRYGDYSRSLAVKMFPPPGDKLSTIESEYRYVFKGPPRQMNDDLIRMIIKGIRELNRSHMLFFATNVWPHNVDTTIPIWPGHAGGAIRSYVFTQALIEFPIVAEVTVVGGTTTLTVDKILIRNKLKMQDARKHPWIPLKDWLLDLPVPNKLTEGNNRFGEPRILDCQRLWWRNNGKRFPLLKLPAETRGLIYLHALGENIYPDTCSDPVVLNQDMVFLGRLDARPLSDGHFQIRDACKRLNPPNYKVLALSKGTRIEALKAAWQGTWKHFWQPSYLNRVLNASVTPNYATWLTRIHVNFSVYYYFREFGIDMTPVANFQAPSRGAGIIQAIPGLKDLELCFSGAQDPTFKENPWRHYYVFNHEATWFKTDPNHKNTSPNPCQEIVVDWILTFAYPYIKHIPKINLTGSISRRLKEKWSTILERKYRERHLDYRTHPYDHAADVAAILGRPIYATPTCFDPALCCNKPPVARKTTQMTDQQVGTAPTSSNHTVQQQAQSTAASSFGQSSTHITQQPETGAAIPSIVRPGVMWSRIQLVRARAS